MKNEPKFAQLFTVLAAIVLFAQSSQAQQQLVYDNSTIDQNVRFNPGTNEVGDQVTLAGTARGVKNFTFEYWGTNFIGNDEQARVRFYKNNGAASPQGALAPGTVLFDSGWFSIVATNRATLIFTDFSSGGGAVVPLMAGLPDSFTWSVQFSGLGPGESAGVDLYGPPTVGGRYSDYWDNTGSGWELRTNSVPPFTEINFAAKITAVVQPSLAIALSGNQVFLSWTNVPGGLDFGLQQATSMSPPGVWSNVTNAPVLVGGQFVVTLPTQPGNRFFRLWLPP